MKITVIRERTGRGVPSTISPPPIGGPTPRGENEAGALQMRLTGGLQGIPPGEAELPPNAVLASRAMLAQILVELAQTRARLDRIQAEIRGILEEEEED